MNPVQRSAAVTPSHTDDAYPKSRSLPLEAIARPAVEWFIWIAFAAAVYSQTGRFDKEIAAYAFGATGWPRTLCIALAVGATCQFCSQFLQIARSGGGGRTAAAPAAERRVSGWRLIQKAAIFVFPLLYLYLMPSIGFYFATPFFVLGMLLLLEVISPVALACVTAVVYGLVLILFTRLFFVALPVGNVDWFYNINNAIITIARAGL